MRFKVLFLMIIVGFISLNTLAQRGVRIGYIDTEYILQNVPEYQEATSQLDKKVQQWKSEIEKKLSTIEQKKKELDNESVLLTKELYEERFEEISFEEAEILDYQQKRFGPNGDLFIQKKQLMQPVQDQIFSAVQEIAGNKKFDFIFDKSADVVMLYSAEQYDVSDQVLRLITRTSNRKQASSKKEREELEEEEIVPEEVSEEKDARLKELEDRKASREKELADKRAEREKALEERRQQQLADREARRKAAEERRQKITDSRNKKEDEPEAENEVPVDTTNTSARGAVPKPALPLKGDTKTDSTIVKNKIKTDSTAIKKNEPKTAAQILEEKKLKKQKEREERAKALEARKQVLIEKQKKAKEEREKQRKKADSIRKAKAGGSDN